MPKTGDLLYNCKSKCFKLLRSSASKLNKRFQVRLVRSTSGVQSYTIRFPGKSGLSRLPEVPGPTAFWDRALLYLTLCRRVALLYSSAYRSCQRLDPGPLLEAVDEVLPVLLVTTEDPQHAQSHGRHAEL